MGCPRSRRFGETWEHRSPYFWLPTRGVFGDRLVEMIFSALSCPSAFLGGDDLIS